MGSPPVANGLAAVAPFRASRFLAKHPIDIANGPWHISPMTNTQTDHAAALATFIAAQERTTSLRHEAARLGAEVLTDESRANYLAAIANYEQSKTDTLLAGSEVARKFAAMTA